MRTDRRKLLAITAALAVGSGCLSEGGGVDDENGDTDGNRTDREGAEEQETEPTGSADKEPPDFPEIEPVTDPVIDTALLAEQVRGNIEFSLEMLRRLADDDGNTNTFYSPYSISVALAMTHAGARGGTADEMREALRFELDDEDLHPAFGSLESEFERRNEDSESVLDEEALDMRDELTEEEFETRFGVPPDEAEHPTFRLSTANALWGQEGFGFRYDFLNLLEEDYGAGMRRVDFAGATEEARERINDWVEEETEGEVEDILGRDDLDTSTRLVLTNAIYFLGMWENDFDEDETESDTFTSLDGSEHEVGMMNGEFDLPYAEVDGHRMVELPYENRDTSMVVVLPAEGEFEEFVAGFSVDRLATMLDDAQESFPEVNLSLPKFSIEWRRSLVETLREMGMESAFDPRSADFSGMTNEDELFVDDIIHQSFVEVDEKGTEAAAATTVVVNRLSGERERETVEMTVDRPFLFYIRDRPTETPLFLGRVVDGAEIQQE